MKKQLSLLVMIVAAAVLAQPSASAQEKKVDKVRSESSFGTVVEQEKPLTRQQLRKQMMNDQVAYNLMRQQAMGEYAARPSVRFPNYVAYQPIYQRVYINYPNNWYVFGR